MKKKLFLLFTLFLFCAAVHSQDKKEISDLRAIADSLHAIGRTDSALIVSEKAVRLAESLNDKVQIVGTLSGQGVYLRSLGRIEEALKDYEKGLSLVTSKEFREHPSQEAIEEISTLYINLAVLNLDMQNKEEACKNAVLAAEWCEKSKDAEFKSTVLGVVGSVLTGSGKLEEAVEYQKSAYGFALESGDKEAAFRAAAYNMLLSDRLGNKSEAAEWRGRCTELMPEVEAMMARLLYYQAECSIAMKNKKPLEAIGWFKKILSLDGIDNLPFVKFDAYNNMHLSYAELGEYENAYNTLIESNVLRDEIWQKEKEENLRDLTVKYETKETQLALAQSEVKRANTLMWLFAALGLLLIIIIMFLSYATRQRRKRVEKELEMANLRAETGREMTRQYIEGLENERLRIAKELHDGVCNDLLAIERTMRNISSHDEGLEMIGECRESVRRISHELMPPEFSYASLDEVVRYYISKQRIANAGKIDFLYLSDQGDNRWDMIPDTIALEVYRIIQETVGNSIKHSGASEISVEMSMHGSELTLTLKDNGRYKGEKGEGIGLESIRKRVESIKGEMNISTSESEGSEWKLIVKLDN